MEYEKHKTEEAKTAPPVDEKTGILLTGFLKIKDVLSDEILVQQRG